MQAVVQVVLFLVATVLVNYKFTMVLIVTWRRLLRATYPPSGMEIVCHVANVKLLSVEKYFVVKNSIVVVIVMRCLRNFIM